MPYRQVVDSFSSYLSARGLKVTQQRLRIAEVVFQADGHLTLPAILERTQKAVPGVGYATVYRTMKLLVEAGLVDQHRFDDKQARFEASSDDHHDHIICVKCGRIVEFEDEDIERRQEGIAQGLGFRVVSHRHEIYGECQPVCPPAGAAS
jgi:Fur family ferric uptake transcriptional regulator